MQLRKHPPSTSRGTKRSRYRVIAAGLVSVLSLGLMAPAMANTAEEDAIAPDVQIVETVETDPAQVVDLPQSEPTVTVPEPTEKAETPAPEEATPEVADAPSISLMSNALG